MGDVKVVIDGKEVVVPEGTTILEAAKKVGVEIPTLCYLNWPGWIKHDIGACRICVVEVEGMKDLVTACNTPVEDGMVIKTCTPRVLEARRMQLELLLSEHHLECTLCPRNGKCELQDLAARLGIRKIRPVGERKVWEKDESSPAIVRDPNKCIVCQRCVNLCANTQTVGALELYGNGVDAIVRPKGGYPLAETQCTFCGQCIHVCPVGAITEKEVIDDVWKALNDPEKFVVVQFAPAIRASLGEELGLPPGEIVVGKIYAALRRLGFDRVWDTNFAADLTITEEAAELVFRLVKNGIISLDDIKGPLIKPDEKILEEVKPALPQFTSCCPAWVKFAETFFPDIALNNVSSCKSPQQMFGPIAKTYAAEKLGIDPRKMVVVSIMPCTAKKFEATRPEMCDAFKYWLEKGIVSENEKFPDVDYVLTNREFAQMIKQAGLNFKELPEECPDPLLGQYTGAAAIFGRTGGVMEAALRTAYEYITGKKLGKLEWEELETLEGVKTATVEINGYEVKVAVVHGLGNARKVCKSVREGGEFSKYTFIEVMACRGGCIGGGGQPIPTREHTIKARVEALSRHDKELPIRKSHENPEIIQLYKDFLGYPVSKLSHHLVHTSYYDRSNTIK